MKHKYKAKYFLLLSFIFLFFTTNTQEKYNTDVIIFSYNRPLQLYALLESMKTYITGVGQINIIYRITSADYDIAYEEVKKTFPYAIFIQQGPNPKKDFKPLTMQCLYKSPSNYILFAVDDIIVKDFIDLNHATKILEETKSYGFYLRLGKNITFNYPRQVQESLPNLITIEDYVLSWKFSDGGCTWRYPNTVDMTIYPKDLVIKDFNSMYFENPNTLEGRWAQKAGKVRNKNGLCYYSSKMVNLPLNRVQNVYKNRHMNLATPQELLEIFNNGFKIDISTLFQINNKSSHMNYEPEIIER